MDKPTVRNLKIERLGDYMRERWQGLRPKPRIRLHGYWLEDAGFIPGQRCTVEVLGQGEMLIKLAPEEEAA